MRPPTQRELDLSAADEILIEPLTSATVGRHHNPVVSDREVSYPSIDGGPPKRRQKKKFELDPTDVYGGYEGLLVRTGLIRSTQYNDKSLPSITSTEDVYRLLTHLASADQEHFVVLPLNTKSQCVAIFEAAKGGVASVSVNMRDVLKVSILTGCQHAIVAHNHPSGNQTPSSDDFATTKAIKDAMACCGMKLLDHVIVASGGHFSFFANNVLLPEERRDDLGPER